MKRLLLACFLALPLARTMEESAHAWFKFGLGGSFNTGVEWGGWDFGLKMQCLDPCYPGCAMPAAEPPKAGPAGSKSPTSYYGPMPYDPGHGYSGYPRPGYLPDFRSSSQPTAPQPAQTERPRVQAVGFDDPFGGFLFED